MCYTFYMNEFLKMDVFFVIASAAVIVLAVFLAILLYYLIGFAGNLKYISDKARAEADNLAQDLQDLRASVRSGGFKLKSALDFFKNFYQRRKTTNKKNK